MARLNHRPRKQLGFKIPYQVFYKLDSHLDVEFSFDFILKRIVNLKLFYNKLFDL